MVTLRPAGSTGTMKSQEQKSMDSKISNQPLFSAHVPHSTSPGAPPS